MSHDAAATSPSPPRTRPARRRGEVWTLPLDGSAEASRLADVEGSLDGPVLTPDGRSLVAVQRMPTQQLSHVSLGDGTQAVPLLPAASLGSTSWPSQPRISPDGRLVAFTDSWQVYVRPLDAPGPCR